MTAQTVETFVLVLSDPEWDQDSQEKARINSTLSFDLPLTTGIRTLSTNSANNGDTIEGLLYVPNLVSSDPCTNSTAPYIPRNVTREASLPPSSYLVAFAPWTPSDCPLSYLASASADGARAFIFYLQDNSTNTPPPVDDPAWGLNDGGDWKLTNKYPVYALPGEYGAIIMQELGKYSGNMTDVPNGHLLTEEYDSRDYVRLYTVVTTGGGSTLPSLWVFLLIVLGILLFMIGLTSALMHFVQARRRQTLRQMISNGDVDLEALGIKRLTVPQAALDKMPLYIYVANDRHLANQPPQNSGILGTVPEAGSGMTLSGSQDFEIQDSPRRKSDPTHVRSFPPCDGRLHDCASSSFNAALPQRQLPFSQPTCSICLEDFVSHRTIVRELPCGHIYHPQCIDSFLRECSSLCPFCKGRVLPKGYCPDVLTDSMVRRERLIRRMRERVTVEVVEEGDTPDTPRRPLAVGRRMASFHRQFGRAARSGGRRVSSAPMPGSRSLEIHQTTSLSQINSSNPPTPVQQNIVSRRMERSRQRVNAILGHQRTADEEDQERQAGLPRWRKAIGIIFPGFR